MNQEKLKWISAQPIDYGQDDAGYYLDHAAPVFTNTFALGSEKDCVCRIAALGFWICRINGQDISDSVLNGPWTNFQKHIYFNKIDISSFVHKGMNTIEVELGNGYYNPSPLRFFGKYNLRKNLSEVGLPEFALQIESGGKNILETDETWTYHDGKILFNNLYLGERVDLRNKEKKDVPAAVQKRTAPLLQQTMPPIRCQEKVDPVSIRPYKDELLVDLGEMVSGFIDIAFTAKENQHVCLRFAECLDHDGTPNYFPNANGSVGETRPDGQKIYGGPGAPETAVEMDEIICHEGLNKFRNTFTYHSFRYCVISGLKEDDIQAIQAIYVHTDVRKTGSVHTSDRFLNELYEAAIRTRLNNLHSSFEDCARERLGYGGDMVSLADSGLYAFDLRAVYEKIILDFIADQTKAGGFPETAPYMGIQSKGTAEKEGPLLWQFAVPYLCFKLLQYYDDKKFVEQAYPSIQKFTDYILSRPIEQISQCCLGDHGSILIMGQFYKPTPDKPLAGYCAVLLILKTFIDISHVLDKEVMEYEKLYAEKKEQTIRTFKKDDGTFGEGTQTGLAFAAMLDLDDPESLTKKLVEKIRADNGIFNAGIFGMKFTYDLLHRYGYDDVIEHWLTQDSEISFRQMLSSGSKAMAELFGGTNYSYNHAMFTSFVQWYFEALGGIQIAQDAIGFDKIVCKPYFSCELDHCDARVETVHGTIESSWKRINGKIEWQLSVPEAIECILPEERSDATLHLTRTK